MQLNPYGQDAVRLAVELVTSPPATPGDLEARCVTAGLVVDRPATETDLAATHRLLDEWCAIVDATEPAVRPAQRPARRIDGHPRLTDHADG